MAPQAVITALEPADYRVMPWQNGGGLTTEIASAKAPDGSLLWRASLADIDRDGPFSMLPGIDRVQMVVEGPGIRLSIAGSAPIALPPLAEPLAYPGDVPVDCSLIGGPVRAFNLMVGRGRGVGSLTLMKNGESRHFGGEAVHLVHSLDGDAHCRLPSASLTVPAEGTMILECVGVTVTAAEQARVIVASILRQ
ncbi:HutD family protein [Telmatospirillum sp. J64-1]|uniref:HutD/Ves family protein n=1 Tax=Telmatospirillum sp. J64-1 TaxID=2502183 RepID=UPI00115DA0CB|nr:HutD family protein [Telmatospirillum sp. J64-1]